MMKERKRGPQVKCPQCKEKFNYYDSEFRPFCSEKCKMIDLGHWLNESYSVPSQGPLSEEEINEIEKSLDKERD